MHSNPIHRVTKTLAALGLALTLPAVASAAPQTYCQENGHGANGCSDLFEGGGYCWESTTSTTGYVCREDDPNAEVSPREQEVVATQDPILVYPGDPGGEVQGLVLEICGPGIWGGCLEWEIEDVDCEDLGLQVADPFTVDSDYTVTCFP